MAIEKPKVMMVGFEFCRVSLPGVKPKKVEFEDWNILIEQSWDALIIDGTVREAPLLAALAMMKNLRQRTRALIVLVTENPMKFPEAMSDIIQCSSIQEAEAAVQPLLRFLNAKRVAYNVFSPGGIVEERDVITPFEKAEAEAEDLLHPSVLRALESAVNWGLTYRFPDYYIRLPT